MDIIKNVKANVLRRRYIKTFVKFKSSYYIENIKKRKRFKDGLCYEGYLWDVLINPNIVSEQEADDVLKNKTNIYIMWDIHSCEKIYVLNYWKYPKNSILNLEKWEDLLKKELPEDIYIYDDTFKWTIVYTHEIDEYDNRYCIYIQNDNINNII